MPRIPKKNQTTQRLTLNMTGAVRSQLEDLRERTGADTLAEVVRHSLALYVFIVKERESGGKLFVENGDARKEVELI